MKRVFILTMGLVVFSLMINAQEQTKKDVKAKAQVEQSQTNQGPNFVDENGDGVCDNFRQGKGRRGNGQGRGNGVCRGRGQGRGQGQGAAYVDKNGDGICDNFKGRRNGQGRRGRCQYSN